MSSIKKLLSLLLCLPFVFMSIAYAVPYNMDDYNFTGETAPVPYADQHNHRGFYLGNNGTTLFTHADATQDTIYSFTLTQPYNISTAGFPGAVPENNALADGNAASVQISPDGTKYWYFGRSAEDMYQYTMSTPFNISTAGVAQNTNLPEVVNGHDFIITQNGENLYVVDNINVSVKHYSLTTPYDTTTVSYVSSFSLTNEITSPQGIDVNSQETKILVLDDSSNSIYEYEMSTPGDLTTMSYTGRLLNTTTETTTQTLWGIQATGADDEYIYVLNSDGGGHTFWKYETSVAPSFSVDIVSPANATNYTYDVEEFTLQAETNFNSTCTYQDTLNSGNLTNFSETGATVHNSTFSMGTPVNSTLEFGIEVSCYSSDLNETQTDFLTVYRQSEPLNYTIFVPQDEQTFDSGTDTIQFHIETNYVSICEFKVNNDSEFTNFSLTNSSIHKHNYTVPNSTYTFNTTFQCYAGFVDEITQKNVTFFVEELAPPGETAEQFGELVEITEGSYTVIGATISNFTDLLTNNIFTLIIVTLLIGGIMILSVIILQSIKNATNSSINNNNKRK